MEFGNCLQGFPAPAPESEQLLPYFSALYCTPQTGCELDKTQHSVKLECSQVDCATKKMKLNDHATVFNTERLETRSSLPGIVTSRAVKQEKNCDSTGQPLDLRKKHVSNCDQSNDCLTNPDTSACSVSRVAPMASKTKKELNKQKLSFWTIDCPKMYIKETCQDGLKLKLRVDDSSKMKLNNVHPVKMERAHRSEANVKMADFSEQNRRQEEGNIVNKSFSWEKLPSDSRMIHVSGTKKAESTSSVQKGSDVFTTVPPLAHHPCLFAIHMDNVSVHQKKDLNGGQVYLVAYSDEMDSLSRLSVEDIETLKGVRVQEPSNGIKVLVAFPKAHVSVSGSLSQPVISVEKTVPQNSHLSALTEIDLLHRGTASLHLESVLLDGKTPHPASSTESKDASHKEVEAPPIEGCCVYDSKCFLCQGMHAHGLCCVKNPPLVIPDSTCCSNSQVLSLTSLPEQLSLVRSSDGFTVCAAEGIKKGTLLGPLRAAKVEAQEVDTLTDLKNIWCVETEACVPSAESSRKHGDQKGKKRKLAWTVLSTESENLSNWCRYLRPVLDQGAANLLSVAHQGSLHFVATRKIPKGEELTYHSPWFGKLDHLPALDSGTHQCCCFCQARLVGAVDLAKHCCVAHPSSFQRHVELCSRCGRVYVAGRGCCWDEKQMQQQLRPMRCQRRRVRAGKGDEDLLKCCECGKSYATSQLLSEHLLVHESYFRFFCQFCSKGFHDKSNLKVHVLVHTGVRPFHCQQPQCSSAFTTKQCLQMHYRKVHGFSDAEMPVIRREVPFTFEAHMADTNQA